MIRWAMLLWLALVAAPAAAADRTPDVVLSGVVRDADRATTRDLGFAVPAGTALVRVDFVYEGRDRGVTITLGVADPQRFRGWGGGTKYAFAIGEAFATPSFLPGPIPAGPWRLMMTVPSIRAGDAAKWTARIWFSKASAVGEVAFSPVPIRPGPGWYRGDLHTHSGQSDARCRSLARREAGCPPFYTFQEAAAHGLDFVALTDHNVTSHFIEMGYLQPHFDTLLLLPGRELTTREGHANLLGYMGPIETDVGRPGTETVNALLAKAHATGGFLTINHPARSTGEDCLGCGWSARDTDYAAVDAIEVVNAGSTLEMPGDREAAIVKQVQYWETLLNRGHRLIGVAGSDNHDAIQYRGKSPIGAQAAIGSIATVVHADDLSQGGILRGLRSGRVFIDLGEQQTREGGRRILDIAARVGAVQAMMGGTLPKPSRRTAVTGSIHAVGVAGGTVELVVDNSIVAVSAVAITGSDQHIAFTLPDARKLRWLRANVRTADGHLWLIGNPIYLR